MNNSLNTVNIAEVLSVSELNKTSKNLLETHIGLRWISGEISNLARPVSGHCYFSLKDDKAQVRGACFKRTVQQMGFELSNGQQVLIQAQVSLYEPRGDYQIIAQNIILSGEGLLQIKFNQLKKSCEKKGMFALENKKKLPSIINTIGLITSTSGAALQDMLKVLKRRSPLISVIIYPATVQGKTAAATICKAIETANLRSECDALILARGGGSLEDLWCFNEEKVAHAIFISRLPIVTGVGHETDVTIADLCADKRAATPSAAAELISPDKKEQLEKLQQLEVILKQSVLRNIQQHQVYINQLKLRLRHPKDKLNELAQTVDQLEHRLHHAIQQTMKSLTATLANNAKILSTLSPLNTLSRGYSIARNENNNLLTSVDNIKIGSNINIDLSDGIIQAEVKKIFASDKVQ
jgi:exodeoxyribonuclease VII large subunit